LWALLKFVKCPYWCLITALYGSLDKIIHCVPLCFLGGPSATPPLGDPAATPPALTIASVVFPWS
jgi:hypothetical protein